MADSRWNAGALDEVVAKWLRVKELVYHAMLNTESFRLWLKDKNSEGFRWEMRVFSVQLERHIFKEGVMPSAAKVKEFESSADKILKVWRKISKYKAKIAHLLEEKAKDEAEWQLELGALEQWFKEISSLIKPIERHSLFAEVMLDEQVICAEDGKLKAIFEQVNSREIKQLMSGYLGVIPNEIEIFCKKCTKMSALLTYFSDISMLRKWQNAAFRALRFEDKAGLKILLQFGEPDLLSFLEENLDLLLPIQERFSSFAYKAPEMRKVSKVVATLFQSPLDRQYAAAMERYGATEIYKEKVNASLDAFLVGADLLHAPSLLMVGRIVVDDLFVTTPYAMPFLLAAFARFERPEQKEQARQLLLAECLNQLNRARLSGYGDEADLHQYNAKRTLEESFSINVRRIAHKLVDKRDVFLEKMSASEAVDLGDLYLALYKIKKDAGYLTLAVPGGGWELQACHCFLAAGKKVLNGSEGAEGDIKSKILISLSSVYSDCLSAVNPEGSDVFADLLDALGLGEVDKIVLTGKTQTLSGLKI